MRLLIAVLVCLGLLGCGGPQAVRGIIAKKQHRPAWTQTTLIMVPSGKSFIMVPQIIHHPEQWDIVIQPDGTNDEPDRRVLVVVSQDYYESAEVGDVWERNDTIHEESR